jgi:hypothetical protein
MAIPPAPHAAPAVRDLDRDKGIPDHLVIVAIGVGLLLVAVGAFFVVNARTNTIGVNFAALLGCSGLGIILTALGGRAVGTWRSWAVGGAAAVAPLLFVLFMSVKSPSPLMALRGEIRARAISPRRRCETHRQYQ